MSLDPASRSPRTWELFDPTRRVMNDAKVDSEKRIKYCQQSLDYLLSFAPHLVKVHEIGSNLPEECLLAIVSFFRLLQLILHNTLDNFT